METLKPLLSLEIPELELICQGKVRNVYDMGDKILFVATDRISAFDVIMANGIPEKGKVLNLISAFWFDLMKDIANHMITVDVDEMIKLDGRLSSYRAELEGRSMLVKKAEPIPVECIVRGYLCGSGWKDYQATGKVSGIELPAGLKLSSKLEEPIFTPSTKADEGHDENITQLQARELVGDETFEYLMKTSLSVYKRARDYAEEKGIIIADTKFEFGKVGDEIILMDEVLTPDSSRFWPMDEYEEGRSQRSFDKQFVRDYLDELDWDKTPPGPELPDNIVSNTADKYKQAYKILTGKDL